MTFLPALLTVLVLSSAPPPASEHWLVVHEDGTVERASAAPDPDSHGPLRAAWAWSDRVAPRRFTADDLRRGAVLPETADRSLVVHLTGVPRDIDGELRLTAAPAAMWGEVPVPLLPRWTPERDRVVAVPRTARTTWRLRVQGSGLGSWWQDVQPTDEGPVLIALAAAEDLSVLIEDAEGGRVPHASVHSLEAGDDRLGPPAGYALHVAEEGRLTIPALPNAGPLRLLVFAEGFVPGAVQGRPPMLPRRLALDPGVGLQGGLADGDGAAVGNAEVMVETLPGGAFPTAWRVRRDSAEDGSFSFDDLPTGAAVLIVRSPGHAALQRRLDLPDTGLDLGTITLSPAVPLTVLVTDDEGRPVEGADVEVSPGSRTVTDGDGVAVIEDAPPRRKIELRADAPGHLPAKLVVRPPRPADDTARLTLHRAHTVTGRLVRADGMPAESGQVRLIDCELSEQNEVRPDGTFRLELVPGRAFELVASTPLTTQVRFSLPPGEPGTVRELGDLVLPPGRTVRGRLLHADDASPVTGARVWTPRDAADPLTSWFRRDLVQATSGADGSFVLTGLGPHPGTVRVEAPALAPLRLEPSFPPNTVDLDLGDLYLTAGAELHVATEGFDPANATLRADLEGRWRTMDMVSAPLVDGQAVLHHLPPGRIVVSAVRGRTLLCEETVDLPAGSGATFATCAASPLRVTGEVHIASVSAGPGRLTWLPAGGEDTGIVLRRRSAAGLERSTGIGGGRPQVDVDVGPDGSFHSDALHPGRWQVLWFGPEGASTEPLIVEIPHTAAHRLVLELPGRGLTGRVVDGKGRPVAGARVRVLESGGVTFVDSAGTFRLVGLEPGLHHLRPEIDGLRGAPVAVEVPADESPPAVELVLTKQRPQAGLAFRVRGADGSPVPGALVMLDLDGHGAPILTTGGEGIVRFEPDPPHPSRLRATALTPDGWALLPWTPWDVAAARGEMSLEVGETGDLRIRTGEETEIRQLRSADGRDLWWMAARLGRRPAWNPDGSALLRNLPSGIYTLVTETGEQQVAVSPDRQTEIDLR